MASKGTINSILALRILTLLVLAASIVYTALNNYKLSDGTKTSFTFLHAYRYVVAVAAIGFLYTLVQIPLAMYESCTGKRLIHNSSMPYLDLYGDMVISLLLGSGVGVGLGVTLEMKRFLNPFFDILLSLGLIDVDEARSKASKFLDKGLISSGILLGGFTLMVVTTILSSLNHSSTSSSKGFFFR
ncbi:hypothetical protein M9H77_14373 [Catharanthus roseus]|uniref:Uncharacterized protein n=1 Tax=Catharanthus roseus TaxID=4058 RepID=A0ACC0BN16_CATRO|nr:hypothetical protein M9H77_14373 [Catharanthus roseus]